MTGAPLSSAWVPWAWRTPMGADHVVGGDEVDRGWLWARREGVAGEGVREAAPARLPGRLVGKVPGPEPLMKRAWRWRKDWFPFEHLGCAAGGWRCSWRGVGGGLTEREGEMEQPSWAGAGEGTNTEMRLNTWVRRKPGGGGPQGPRHQRGLRLKEMLGFQL